MGPPAASGAEIVRYPARFVDRFGESEASFEPDGCGFTLSFRSLRFSTKGHSNIEWLALEGDPAGAEGSVIVDREGEIREGALTVGLVIDEFVGADVRPAVLWMTITFEDDASRFVFSLRLELDGVRRGPAVGGEEFEGALYRLRAVLPAEVRLRMCSTCLLSTAIAGPGSPPDRAIDGVACGVRG